MPHAIQTPQGFLAVHTINGASAYIHNATEPQAFPETVDAVRAVGEAFRQIGFKFPFRLIPIYRHKGHRTVNNHNHQ